MERESEISSCLPWAQPHLCPPVQAAVGTVGQTRSWYTVRTQGTWVLGVRRFRVAPRLQSVGRLEKGPWQNSSCPPSTVTTNQSRVSTGSCHLTHKAQEQCPDSGRQAQARLCAQLVPELPGWARWALHGTHRPLPRVQMGRVVGP